MLEQFELMPFFEFVSGPTIPMPKSEQLLALLSAGAIDADALMIGDRSVDLQAAHSNGLSSAGVLWGYGDHDELAQEGPAHLFTTPEDLTVSLSD